MKDLNIISNIPIILCVSTDDNIQQSIDRSGGKYGNKGEDSADAALKMILINSK
jgi:6,7-dimethyl-8-ribityllumazine synthase